MDAQLESFSLTIIATTIIVGILSSLALAIVYFFRGRKIELLNKMRELETEAERKILERELYIKELTLSGISRDLHDNIGYGLTLLKLRLYNLAEETESRLNEEINNCINETSIILDDVRGISRRLSSDFIIENGLIPTIKNDISRLNEIQKVEFNLEISIEELNLSHKVVIILYRIIQETINNVLRHSNATKCILSISEDDQTTRLSIEDNGIGITNNTENMKNKNGLINLKKSSESIDATISFENLYPGFKITLLIPKLINHEI